MSHILESIDRILGYTRSESPDALAKDALVYYGIVKNIEIIGEAAYKLSLLFKSRHPETPWENIVKMRHVLVHDYYQIDEEDVWQVVEEDLPPLRDQVVRYLNETDWEQWEQQDP